MTKLSVNINKIARRFLQLGAHGITLHPRQDQRHARYTDVHELQALCVEQGAELNVEGFPSDEFLAVVSQARPAQCTLVPDAPGQLTSDHGWDLSGDGAMLRRVIAHLKALGIRTSLFVDHDTPGLRLARELGADRVELYTEPYAVHFDAPEGPGMFEGFRTAVTRARPRAGCERGP